MLMYASGPTGKFRGLRTKFGTHIFVLVNFQQAPACGEGESKCGLVFLGIQIHVGIAKNP
jgi:hypothetical protein